MPFNRDGLLASIQSLKADLSKLEHYIESQDAKAEFVESSVYNFPYTKDGFTTADKVRQGFQDVTAALVNPSQYLTEIVSSTLEASALGALVEVGVPEALGTETIDADTLSKKLSVDSRRLVGLMRGVIPLGFFSEEAMSGKFKNTKLSTMLRKDDPSCSWAVSGYLNTQVLPSCEYMTDCLKDGTKSAADIYFKKSYFAHIAETPKDAEQFDKVMISMSGILAGGLSSDYDWGKHTTIVDIGSGIGAMPMIIAPMHPNVNFICNDLAPVIKNGQGFWAATFPQLAPRVTWREYDFFSGPPAAAPDGAVYLMRFILHDWPDAKAVEILDNIRKGVKPGTLLLVADLVMEESNIRWKRQMDLHMMSMFSSIERTMPEFEALAKQSGWKVGTFHPSRGPMGIIEFIAV